MKGLDFGRAATDYVRHRAGFPDSFFRQLRERQLGLAGQHVVDLGTGTGQVATVFADQECQVVGVDTSPRMLQAARAQDPQQRIRFVEAPAEATGLPDASADLVCACQCWHWFDRDRAGAEVRRILRFSGAVVIAHFDWLPLDNNVVAQTEALIEAHNPSWSLGGGCGIYSSWFQDLARSRFERLESFTYDSVVSYSHEAWRGRIRASAGVGGTLDASAVVAFDAALAQLLTTEGHPDPLEIPHRLFCLIGRKP